MPLIKWFNMLGPCLGNNSNGEGRRERERERERKGEGEGERERDSERERERERENKVVELSEVSMPLQIPYPLLAVIR